MFKLSENDKKTIAEAVKNAEKNTGGEIVAAVIPESSDYAFYELLFAIAAGMIIYIVLIFYSTRLHTLLDSIFWSDSVYLLPSAMMIISFAAGTMFYFIAQFPVIDRLVISKKSMEKKVRSNALRFFVESGICDTMDRTGVLLFISVLERRVELIADNGINNKVAPDTWDRIVSSMIRGIKEKRISEAIVEAVNEIGEILAEHVPPRENDINEIADGPVELKKGY